MSVRHGCRTCKHVGQCSELMNTCFISAVLAKVISLVGWPDSVPSLCEFSAVTWLVLVLGFRVAEPQAHAPQALELPCRQLSHATVTKHSTVTKSGLFTMSETHASSRPVLQNDTWPCLILAIVTQPGLF